MTLPSASLIAILRIESSEGFTLKFNHPDFGELSLAIVDPTGILSVTQEETGTPPTKEVDALRAACDTCLEKRDLPGAFAEAEAFSERYPVFGYAYALQGAFALDMGHVEAAAFYMRQAIAIQPSFTALGELGRALGKQAKLEDALVLYSFLFENRQEASSEKQAIRFTESLLLTLNRLKRGEEMVRVADTAIADYGDHAFFQYQAILGLIISEYFGPALSRIEAVAPGIDQDDIVKVKLTRLKGGLKEKLSAQKGGSPSSAKTRFFIAGQRPVKIEDGPQGRREFAMDWKTGEFVETDRYIEKIFRDHSPDIDEVEQAAFDQLVSKSRAKISNAKRSAPLAWALGEETCFQYGIGNPSSPTDPFGRQEIQIYPDDTLEYIEIGRGGRRCLKAEVKAGLMREICATLRSGMFPDAPSKTAPAGAALATYRLWKEKEKSTAVVYPNSAVGWEGYGAVQPLMNSMARTLFRAARGPVESEHFFNVTDVAFEPSKSKKTHPDPSVPVTQYFFFGHRPVQIVRSPDGVVAHGIDFDTGEMVSDDSLVALLNEPQANEIQRIQKKRFDVMVASIRDRLDYVRGN
jgi:tetratricopeptide (TPR) repeat protein